MRIGNAEGGSPIKLQYVVYNIALLLSFVATFRLLISIIGHLDVTLCRQEVYCGNVLYGYIEWWKTEVMPLLAISVFFWLPVYQHASQHKNLAFILVFPLLLSVIIMIVNMVMMFPIIDFYEQYLYFITLLVFLLVFVFILQITEMLLKHTVMKYFDSRD